MKATKLMLGDYVSCWEGHPTKVVSIDYDYNEVNNIVWCKEPNNHLSVRFMLDEIEPIPLTPEILVKNGLETKDGDEFVLFDNSKIDTIGEFTIIRYYAKACRLWICKGDGVRENEIRIKCQYVHELQHALKLCGIDKEIIL